MQQLRMEEAVGGALPCTLPGIPPHHLVATGPHADYWKVAAANLPKTKEVEVCRHCSAICVVVVVVVGIRGCISFGVLQKHAT